MQPTDLATLDTALTTRRARLAELLPGDLTPERLIQSVRLAAWRNPKLLECTLSSLVGAAYDAAVLGLECSGTTHQAYLIPFKGRASLVVGARGVVLVGARAGYTVTAKAVMQGDDFTFEEGSGGFVRHVPDLMRAKRAPIVAAWAMASPRDGQGLPIVSVVPRWRLDEIRARSPGARKPDSPWNDLDGPGYEGMAQKSAIRPLLKLLPVVERQHQVAARVGLGDSAEQDPQGLIGTTRPQGRAATRRPTTIDVEELPTDDAAAPDLFDDPSAYPEGDKSAGA